MENIDPNNEMRVYYQINYTLTEVPEDAAYFLSLIHISSVMTPSQILYRDLQVLVEAYRVKDMPAVQPESGHRTVPVSYTHLVYKRQSWIHTVRKLVNL